MFNKVLIANRGEIALRIIRACRELGVKTVVAYSEADRESLPVRMADERICIGPGPSSKSYLHIPNLISAALLTNSDAIHPGYGFLSENPSFAEVCADCGVVFIGPPPAAMVQMGDKVQAREAMARAGLPMLPGTDVLRSVGEGEEAAARIGFPLMLKAAAGGGGRGIRLVRRPEEFTHVFTTAQSEVREAFHDDGLYVEKYLGRAQHVEVQVLCDNFGNGVYLGERNCSVQRRHQKLAEESPSPGLAEALRQEMGQRAIQAALAIGYRGVGTLEFLVDEEGHYYFMEMNTRLQVEHPVTELVTGVDLVQAQLRVAAGEPMELRQEDITLRGHAIEFRITAEDPALDFRPQTGTIEEYLPPSGPGVRVDSHLYRGYEVPPHYDSLLAKLIVWAPTREQAIARGRRALHEFVLEGVPTTIPFHLRLLENDYFIRGETYTNFLAEHSAEFALKV
ncbi:MAG: acetyl-CoA carboxylase biotin carboxylase subunit [Ktedonobacterales bacterium]|nr:acetyl-CoA carboxylase biotin carboxylase subunit [Ktedonobacterales bacterium]